MEFTVDDAAEEGDDDDRAWAKIMNVAARTQRWESLLEDVPAGSSSAVERGRASTSADGGVDDGASSAIGNGVAKASAINSTARRGMVRRLYLLLDMTDASRQPDYKPRRLEFMVDVVHRFAKRFLLENPLSEIGAAILRDGTCDVAVPSCGSVEEFSAGVTAAAASGPRGRMSVVSGLIRATASLATAPPYSTKETVLVFASLSTFDAIDTSIEEATKPLQNIGSRVSVVSMSPELFVLRRVCNETGGSYGVALDGQHFDELLGSHVTAPTCGGGVIVPTLIRMGFPRQSKPEHSPAVCICHGLLRPHVFECPQCRAAVCSVPSRCPTCEIPLASAPMIARTFQQLFPVPVFERLLAVEPVALERCGACCANAYLRCRCPRCRFCVCEACDSFIHDKLRQCPGCIEAM